VHTVTVVTGGFLLLALFSRLMSGSRRVGLGRMLAVVPGIAVLFAVAGCSPAAPPAPPAPAPVDKTPFPDFGHMPAPSAYSGPVFELSQDYPGTPPPASALPAFMTMDFQKDWKTYMLAVRSYCLEGNAENDWRVENNQVRRWYHIPWQHYGPSGREGVHGLTKEAPVQPRQLAPTQTYTGGQTYAVGIFNEFGGYTIGQVWADHKDPDPDRTTAPAGFLEGTVICKALFVDVPAAQVPSLVNPVQWQAYITDVYNSENRSMRTVSLIQMDMAVKDRRAPTGWIFGTFQYNGAMKAANPWENLVPVGLMWGNDPDITGDTYTNPTPTVTRINPNLKETVINPDADELPPTHLGWNGRLNGPVDNPRSSCMSCHMTAEVPALSPLTPFFQANPPPIGSPEWMRWFQNIACGVPFDAEAKSADFSLQLSIGITNFVTWRDTQDGLYASQYAGTGAPAAQPVGAAQPHRKVPSAAGRTVHPIVRDMDPAQIPKR
jgi:hypothetical protein